MRRLVRSDRPQICGVIDDDVARRLDEGDALERLVRELEARAPAGESRKPKAASASTDAPAAPRNGKPPFDRRSYHARYMRAWPP
jgi:hypothetical protein